MTTKFLCLDLETTGFNPTHDRIIEVAAAVFDLDGKIHKTYSKLVNPGFTIPEFIQSLTGISNEALQNAPQFRDIQNEVQMLCGEGLPMVGHNISFDHGFLTANGIEEIKTLFDTVELARILFPKERSYSLEILAKTFSLPHIPSHRALDDVLTTIDLFLALAHAAAEVPSDVKDILASIFAKTDWPLKEVFSLGAPGVTKSPRRETISRRAGNNKPFGDVSALFTNSVIESQATVRISDLPKNKKILLTYGTIQRGQDLESEAQNTDYATTLHDSQLYLSPKKLHLMMTKESLANEEASFLTKILLWKNGTLTGMRHEINLTGIEYSLWDGVADTKGNDDYFKAAFSKALCAPIVITHHAFLTSTHCSELHREHVVVDEALLLEDNLTRALEKRFTQEMFETVLGSDAADSAMAGRITVLFGLIGMYFEKYTDHSFKSDVVVGKEFPHTIEGKKIIEALSAIIESVGENTSVRDMFAALLELFSTKDRNRVAYISGYSGTIHVVSVPLTVDMEQIQAAVKTVSFIDSALSLEKNFDFFTNIFHLSNDYTYSIAEPFRLKNLKIDIPTQIPEPNTPGYFKKYVALVKKEIDGNRGGILIMLHTKKGVEASYNELLPYAENLQIPLYAQGVTGGRGKVLELFAENPAGSILIGLASIFSLVQTVENDIRCIIFQKIPFDFSSNPIFQARPNLYMDGFKSYTLPRALLRFKKFLAELNKTEQKKKVVILDRRLLDRDYGTAFINEIL